MKKYSKFAALMLMTVLVFASVVPSFAAGGVAYDGQVKKFDFTPGSETSASDLFKNFKGVMPGDVLGEKIEVSNRSDKAVKVYMRVLGAEEGSEELLSQFGITVDLKGKGRIFDSTAAATAQLTDWYLLGELPAGASGIELDVQLTAPIELDSKFADSIGYFDWQFKVEEIEEPIPPEPPIDDPDEPDEPEPIPPEPPIDDPEPVPPGPKTGDNSYLWVVAAGGALLGMIVVLLTGRKRKNEE